MMFAEKTSVPVAKSKTEIEQLLRKYKATDYVSGWNGKQIFVLFRIENRLIRFQVATPDMETIKKQKKARTPLQIQNAMEQEERRLWRCLCLVIKGKLESVETGIETLEEAFLPQTVITNGETFGEWAHRELDNAIAQGKMPQLLMITNGKQ